MRPHKRILGVAPSLFAVLALSAAPVVADARSHDDLKRIAHSATFRAPFVESIAYSQRELDWKDVSQFRIIVKGTSTNSPFSGVVDLESG